MKSKTSLWTYLLAVLLVSISTSRCGKPPQEEVITLVTDTISPSVAATLTLPLTTTITPETPTPTASPVPSPTSMPASRVTAISTTFTYTEFTGVLSEELEPYVYIATSFSTPPGATISDEAIWQLNLGDGTYKQLVSWPLSEATDVVNRLPADFKTEFCKTHEIEPQDLSKLKTWFNIADIHLSPDGQYLAIRIIVWLYDSDLLPLDSGLVPVENIAIVLDVDTEEQVIIQTRQLEQPNAGWDNFRWSPDSNWLALEWSRKYDNDSLFVYGLASATLTPVGEEYDAVWSDDSKHLILQNRQAENDARLLLFDVGDQLTRTLDLPASKQLIGSETGIAWIIHSDDVSDLHLSKLDADLNEVNLVAQVTGLRMTSPQGSPDGTLIAYQSHLPSQEESLQVLDTVSQESYTILADPAYSWEWANANEALLVSFWDEDQTKQMAILQLEEATITLLPLPPDSNWISDVTW